MIAEILMPCYFGSLVTESSFEIIRDVYDSDWMRFRHSRKKALIIFLIRANKPIRFYAGKTFLLGLSSFIAVSMAFEDGNWVQRRVIASFQILRMAYSLFAVMKKTQ